MVKLKKGILIVFEGVDGAGKSTQARLLFERLKKAKFNVIFSKEPTEGEWGQKLKKGIKGGREAITPEEELEWFLRDRQQHVEKIIMPGLCEKKIVVLDRYYFSTIAYQGALGLNLEEIERKNAAFAPQPDILFLIEIAPDVGLRRIAKSRESGADFFEKEAYLSKVNEVFTAVSRPFLHRLRGDEAVHELENQVWDTTITFIKEKGLIEEERKNFCCPSPVSNKN